MQTFFKSTRGLSLLININWDRLIYLATVVCALLLGAWIGSNAPY